MKNSTRAMMIDIETLDTKASSVVIQTACVIFDYNDKGQVSIIGEGNSFLNVGDQLKIGRTISEDTVKFWLSNSDNQGVLGDILSQGSKFEKGQLKDMVQDTLTLFKDTPDVVEIWSQGPTFDIIILEDMCKQLGLQVPWKFYQVRDLRTVQKFVGDDAKSIKMKAENSNHNALDDCHSQIKLLQHFIKKAKK